jgi:hypothetical protein
VALGIVAACGTNHIHEYLIVSILHFEVLGSRFAPVIFDMHFVSSCESKTIIIIGKLRGDIHPEERKLLAVFFLILIGRTTFEPFFMMHIDDNLQTVVKAPAHYLLDTGNPSLVDAHRLSVGNVALPTDWNTDGIETCLLHGLYHLLGNNGIAPGCLCMDRTIRVANLHRLTILSRS